MIAKGHADRDGSEPKWQEIVDYKSLFNILRFGFETAILNTDSETSNVLGQDTADGEPGLTHSQTIRSAGSKTGAAAKPPIKPDSVGSTMEPTQEWRSGYLGLEFHDVARRVRRQGVKAEPVDLSTNNLLWHVLLKLEAIKSGFLSYEGLLPVWEKYGQEDRPTRSTVTKGISALNKLVESLQIKAKASKKVGWRLMDPSAAAKPESKQPRRASPRRRS